jgi:hypothetical protein
MRKSQSKYGTALSYPVLECDHTHAWYRTRLGAVKPEMAIAAAIRLQQLGIAASACACHADRRLVILRSTLVRSLRAIGLAGREEQDAGDRPAQGGGQAAEGGTHSHSGPNRWPQPPSKQANKQAAAAGEAQLRAIAFRLTLFGCLVQVERTRRSELVLNSSAQCLKLSLKGLP